MNIIFQPTYHFSCQSAAVQLLEKHNPDAVFILGTDRLIREKVGKTLRGQYYLYPKYPIRLGDYSNMPCADEMLPLNPELLDAYLPYEMTTLDMIARAAGQAGVVLSWQEHREVMHKHLAYWNTIVERYEIGAYLSFIIPHGVHEYVAYAVCKIKKIPTYLMHYAMLNDYNFVLEDIYAPCPQLQTRMHTLQRTYRDAQEDEILLPERYQAEYEKYAKSSGDLTPKYMKAVLENATEKPMMQKVRNLWADKERSFVDGAVGWAGRRLKRRAETVLSYWKSPRSAAHKKAVDKEAKNYRAHWEALSEAPDLSKPYVYVPLHLQPECSTLPMAGHFSDQRLYIAMLSACLPSGMAIYVKENPKQTALGRTARYPEELLAIPGVQLMPLVFDTMTLIDHALAVASLTGTALFEAAFRKKPGIMGGFHIHQYMPGIHHVHTMEEMKVAVQSILEGKTQISDKDLRIFMLAFSEVSFLGLPYGLTDESEYTQRAKNIYEAFDPLLLKAKA